VGLRNETVPVVFPEVDLPALKQHCFFKKIKTEAALSTRECMPQSRLSQQVPGAPCTTMPLKKNANAWVAVCSLKLRSALGASEDCSSKQQPGDAGIQLGVS
jgi:hypothetical protein